MDPESTSGSRLDWPDLAALRRSRKISVDQIAATTKIGPCYLQAIEGGDFDRLPGGIFSTSYIRQYARAIDLDEEDLVARFNVRAESAIAVRTPLQGENGHSPRRFRLLVDRFVACLRAGQG